MKGGTLKWRITPVTRPTKSDGGCASAEQSEPSNEGIWELTK